MDRSTPTRRHQVLHTSVRSVQRMEGVLVP